MSKTIGVLGGMGPYATLDFIRLLLDTTGAERECDHFRIVVDSNPKIPSRTRAYLFGEADPAPMMIESALNLIRAGADFIVLPCNSAHFFLPKVLESVDVSVIDMIGATAEVIINKNWKKVGVIAGEVTVGARLYESYLNPEKIDVVHVNIEEQKIVRRIIEDVKSNVITDQTSVLLSNLITTLNERGAEAIILGCTELQAVKCNLQLNVPIIDSLAVLARAAISHAGAIDIK